MEKSYVDYLIANRKSENTIKNYTRHIQNFLNFVGKSEKDISFSDMVAWQRSISNLSSSSMALEINAIKSYFKYLKAAGFIKDNPAEDLVLPKVKNKVKPYCTIEIITNMINNTRSYRDKAVLSLVASTGIRMSEMAQITMEQWENMKRYNGRNITILGKGDKERSIYINDMAMKAIDDYVAHKKRTEKYLFESNGGKVMDDSNLNKMIKKTAQKANIPFWENMSCHTLRAAFATIASDKGVPVAVISSALGHASLATTSKYIKTCQAQVNDVMSNMIF